MNKLNLTGLIFGDLTVLQIADIKNKKVRWLCRCICGAEKPVYATHLVRGNTKTCTTGGTHGLGHATPGYLNWLAMRTRCKNPEHIHYSRYGGRGISVCDRWLHSFENFYQDMGPRPKGHTLDRIDVNGNYEPLNCRWATNKEQQNNMRSNRLVVIDGINLTIAQHSERMGVKYQTLYARLARGSKI